MFMLPTNGDVCSVSLKIPTIVNSLLTSLSLLTRVKRIPGFKGNLNILFAISLPMTIPLLSDSRRKRPISMDSNRSCSLDGEMAFNENERSSSLNFIDIPLHVLAIRFLLQLYSQGREY